MRICTFERHTIARTEPFEESHQITHRAFVNSSVDIKGWEHDQVALSVGCVREICERLVWLKMVRWSPNETTFHGSQLQSVKALLPFQRTLVSQAKCCQTRDTLSLSRRKHSKNALPLFQKRPSHQKPRKGGSACDKIFLLPMTLIFLCRRPSVDKMYP